MNKIDPHLLLSQLQWRYATKQFDPHKKISAQDWAVLEDALVLTPSSFGLQPWKFVVVDDPATREKLLPVSWGQRQIVDASHLVVFAIKKNIGERDLDIYLERMMEVRAAPREALKGLREMMLGSLVKGMSEDGRREWAARQVYIALGNFMTCAALLNIDACPMEGIEAAKYDEILGLDKEGLATVVVATAGHRAATDKHASMKKVRFLKEHVILRK